MREETHRVRAGSTNVPVADATGLTFLSIADVIMTRCQTGFYTDINCKHFATKSRRPALAVILQATLTDDASALVQR